MYWKEYDITLEVGDKLIFNLNFYGSSGIFCVVLCSKKNRILTKTLSSFENKNELFSEVSWKQDEMYDFYPSKELLRKKNFKKLIAQ